MNVVEQYYFDELAKEMRGLIASIVKETVAETLALTAQTKGDAISQRQAEKEFGRAWLHSHIAVEGTKLFTQGPMDLGTLSKNRKRTFSRAQLAEIKMREQDNMVLAKFICNFHRVMEGYDDFTSMPVGVREMAIREKEIRIEAQRERLEHDKLCKPGYLRPGRKNRKTKIDIEIEPVNTESTKTK